MKERKREAETKFVVRRQFVLGRDFVIGTIGTIYDWYDWGRNGKQIYDEA